MLVEVFDSLPLRLRCSVIPHRAQVRKVLAVENSVIVEVTKELGLLMETQSWVLSGLPSCFSSFQ